MLDIRAPQPTSTSVFIAHCDAMLRALDTTPVDEATWQAHETAALDQIKSGMFIDRHVLVPALFRSGSGRLAQAAYMRTGEDTWERFAAGVTGGMQLPAFKRLSLADIEWYYSIGLGPILRHALSRDFFYRDAPSLLERLYRSRLSLLDVIEVWAFRQQRIPKVPNLAASVASLLEELKQSKEGRETLRELLETALSGVDFRLVSALLAAGARLGPEDPPGAYTDVKSHISLLESLRTQHGRLKTLSLERTVIDILSRPSQGPFHGIIPMPHQQDTAQ